MKSEIILSAMGKIRNDLIEDAAIVEKNKHHTATWLRWGAIAACLCLLVVGAFIAPALIKHTPPFVADVAPMVYVNDTLYKQSTTQISYTELKEEFDYLGEIESEVINDKSISDGIPNKNFQANHSIVGSAVYQYNNNIVVEINGKYWLYEYFISDNN